MPSLIELLCGWMNPSFTCCINANLKGQLINMPIAQFIEDCRTSQGSERANFQTFINRLCVEVIGVDAPSLTAANEELDQYTFERRVTFNHATGTTSTGFIDLYKRGCFVMEAKQGTDRTGATDDRQADLLGGAPRPQTKGTAVRGTRGWGEAMIKAKGQAYNYARALPASEGWPPFLIIVDVGHVIELYADFSGAGKNYTQFPDGARFRIPIEDLTKPEIREQLKAIWEDPMSLDPARKSAAATREIADRLARLGKSFEAQGHDSEKVARFLMRCLFSMFAEDVRLIPEDSFTNVLREMRGHPEHTAPTLESLWEKMNTGGFSPVLRTDLLRFNGGLFADADALPVNALQLGLLIEAAERDWREVEPAIFGTLLERALDKRQRHKLGAHYTPRPYVERLVQPTIVEPLRKDWLNVQAAAVALSNQGKEEKARDEVRAFHRYLCTIRVLDPACGSGNFLYVALEQMKRLEGEVTDLLTQLGEDQSALALESYTVDPHQFLGIELNPWAARVAELVLWIGYLQWHFRTYGKATPAEPVLRDFHNIEHRDAVLDHGAPTPRMDADGRPVTRWDGITKMRHPATGEDVPDPSARVPVLDYPNPRPAKWPDAEFIVGNPPFIGASRLRDALGDGYAEALWAAYPKMPRSCDFVMFWWEKAALKARAWNPAKTGGARRFGFITTNSLHQTFNRRVIEPHLNDPKTPLSLVFAIPDHPWVDGADGADVRIACTVAAAGDRPGRLMRVISEAPDVQPELGRKIELDGQKGKLFANLRIGADLGSLKPLLANSTIAHRGVQTIGAGFIVTEAKAKALGLGQDPEVAAVIRPYRNGRDLTAKPRGVRVIDLFGLSAADVRHRFPAIYQHVQDTVKPERDQNNRKSYRDNWWIFGEPRRDLRPALAGLPRYLATVETAKHRIFIFLSAEVTPDNKLIAIALSDAADLAVLSSQWHGIWAVASGGRLGVGNDPVYAKSRCFEPYPFPILAPAQRAHLRLLGEELYAHRKERQAAHPKLTLTQMYNTLEKLRAGEVLEGKDKAIYQDGLVGILKDIHDRIDAAVADAYGWPVDLSDDDLLLRLVALNKERAAEEKRGLIRWLRPEYQNPTGKTAAAAAEQGEIAVEIAAKTKKPSLPKSLPEQISTVREILSDLGEATPEQIARHFSRGRAGAIEPLLDSLAALGQARKLDGGGYTI